MSITPVLLYPLKILLVGRIMTSRICCCERGIVRVCVKILEGSISVMPFVDDMPFDTDSSVSDGEYGSVIMCSSELSSESDDSDDSW